METNSRNSCSSLMDFLCRALILSSVLLGRFHSASIHAAATSTSFVLNAFSGSSSIALSGIAAFDDGSIRLTNISTRFVGRALYSSPVKIKNSSAGTVSSFATTFVFSITPMYPTLGGHGMAFLMAPSLDSSSAFPSQYLGLLNATDVGNESNHLFAVEFDVVQDLEFWDINDNHVGINLNSMISTHSTTAAYWTPQRAEVVLNLKSGQNFQAWIRYNGLKQQLNVSVAPFGEPQPEIPLLSVHVDLSDVLEEFTYVGFSASTGLLSGVHRLLAWSFNTDGDADNFNVSEISFTLLESPHSSSKRLILGLTMAGIGLLMVAASAAAVWRKRNSQRVVMADWEQEFQLLRYDYKELSVATKGFHEKAMLGAGGFGRVYRGVLPSSGREVAVKRLSRESDQGEREFIAEMASTGLLRHRNLVRLLGWSRNKGELLLVYDYMPNGSLDKMLFGKRSVVLGWEQRYKILSGVAAGMTYLHEGWEKQVLHRDVKASNVLLDADMNPRLGDFGLARLYEHGQNPHTTRVVGTLGYLAPEYSRTGKATTSTDVFSFGALLLEVATGRRPLELRDLEDFLLVEHVMGLNCEGKLLDAADPRLEGRFQVEEMKRVLLLGLWCSHPHPSSRPSMRVVMQVLAKEAPLPLPSFKAASARPSSDSPSRLSSLIRSWSTASARSTRSAR